MPISPELNWKVTGYRVVTILVDIKEVNKAKRGQQNGL